MFDNKEIEAYRKISAPTDLREKVLASCMENEKPVRNTLRMIRTVSTFAACLILVICFSAMAIANSGAAVISVSGNVLEKEMQTVIENGVAPMSYDQRSLTLVDIPLTLDVDRETEITVSDGVLCVMCENSDEIQTTVLSGTVYRTDTAVDLIWSVSQDAEQKNFEMTLKSLFKTETITLAYDENTGVWVISRSK